jgi:hypothetical protein
MAGRIQQGTQAPEYAPGRPNQVIGVVPVQQFAVKFTDGDSRISACLAISFGKDKEDGGELVCILAEQVQMTEQLKIAGPLVRDAVRRFMAAQQPVTADNIPASILSVDDGSVGDISKTPVG